MICSVCDKRKRGRMAECERCGCQVCKDCRIGNLCPDCMESVNSDVLAEEAAMQEEDDA